MLKESTQPAIHERISNNDSARFQQLTPLASVRIGSVYNFPLFPTVRRRLKLTEPQCRFGGKKRHMFFNVFPFKSTKEINFQYFNILPIAIFYL